MEIEVTELFDIVHSSTHELNQNQANDRPVAPRQSPTIMADSSEELYERCCKQANSSEEGYKKTFKQDELLQLCQDGENESLKAVTGGDKLLPLISRLSKQWLIITHKTSNGTSWAVRPRKVASQVRSLGADERMVFEVIEASYEEGIWIRTIKNKTGIKDTHSLDKLVAKLQRQKLIKSIKNVKAMTQKTYMLSYLAPSDTVTGGSFYDAGVLDESLVDEVSNIIIFHVRMLSWGAPPKEKRIKKESSPILIRDDAEHEAGPPAKKRRKSTTGAAVKTEDIEDLGTARRPRKRPHLDPDTQLARIAGYAYPTATAIHEYILGTGILKGKGSSLTVDEIQNVLNVLVWDEKLEHINGGYRTVRGVKFKHPGVEEDVVITAESKRGNGLTEAPCGRCPVIDICGNGGVINAETCVYFGEWLSGGATVTA